MQGGNNERKETVVVPVSYNKRDLILYALGIGSSDMRFIYEKAGDFASFPTYPFVLGFKGTSEDVVDFPSPPMRASAAASKIKPKGPALDGERQIQIHKQLPTNGADLMLHSTVIGVHPKRSGTLVESLMEIKGKDGTPYATITTGTFYVGVKDAKKYGKAHSRNVKIPDRAPDLVTVQKTSKSQAELYRLSGDYNPLHIDAKQAKRFKFPRPILHGLCTLGHSARHVLAAFGGNDPSRMQVGDDDVRGGGGGGGGDGGNENEREKTMLSMCVRFSSPVLPGETLVTRMWKVSGGNNVGTESVVFETRVKETNKVVMSRCEMVLLKQRPRAKL